MTELTDFFIVRYGRLTFSCYVNSLAQMVPKCSLALKIGFVDMWPATLGTRGFSRLRRELSLLAEGRHIFYRRPKPREKRAGYYKDLTETGNRARKVSGTQGSDRQGVLSFQVFLNRRITLFLFSP